MNAFRGTTAHDLPARHHLDAAHGVRRTLLTVRDGVAVWRLDAPTGGAFVDAFGRLAVWAAFDLAGRRIDGGRGDLATALRDATDTLIAASAA